MLDQGQLGFGEREGLVASARSKCSEGKSDPFGRSRFRISSMAGHDAKMALASTAREVLLSPAMLAFALLCHLPMAAQGWNGGSDDGSTSLYSASDRRHEWMYSSSSIHIEYVGCAWGYVEGGDDYHEDMGCRESESEDGTYYWYQMANCRRAQVVYNVYAGGSCSSSTFKESFMTKAGLSEFIYVMNNYDTYSPLYNVDADDYPMCESDGNGYYLSVGCDSSGDFVVNKFSDEYCLEYYGEDQNYDMSSINYALKNMQDCYSAYDSSKGVSVYQTALSYALAYSEPCTSIDSPLCTDGQSLGKSGRTRHKVHSAVSGSSITNKLKYISGSLLLVASVTMFMGILFTNRRRRRAMMHRRFRQSASRSSRSRSRRAHSSRSKSRTRSSSRKKHSDEGGVKGGVFT